MNGSLTIADGATLAIPSGYKLIIDKASGSSLVIEEGGKLVVNKT